MKLKYLAHAAFLMTSKQGTKVLIDPYESAGFGGAIGYQPIKDRVDIIVTSHQHADHAYIAPWHRGVKIISEPGEHKHEDVTAKGVVSFHDSKDGVERGQNIIFTFVIDGIVICHLGDLGHVLNNDQIAQIGKPDVLLLPVGGVFTLGPSEANDVIAMLNPKVVIPMHYKTEKLAFGLMSLDKFTIGKTNVKFHNISEIAINDSSLPRENEIWVLEQANY